MPVEAKATNQDTGSTHPHCHPKVPILLILYELFFTVNENQPYKFVRKQA
jgi:hypothetical protein